MSIATEISRLQGAKSDIRQALIDKGVDVPSTDTIDEYAQYIQGMSSGDVTNGTIQEMYAASGAVDANTFVEFVNQMGTDTAISSVSGSGQYQFSAAALDNNRVFVAFYDGSSTYNLGTVVCTISGGTITIGEETLLPFDSFGLSERSVVALSDNKVCIFFYVGSSNRYLWGAVCTVNGSTITYDSSTQLSTTVNSGQHISAVALDESRVFIAHSYSSNFFLYGIVCTISGTTITAGTDTQLNNTSNGVQQGLSATLLSDDKIFIAHGVNTSSSNRLYGIVCTISGTTITAGTDTQISSTAYSGVTCSVVALDENRVFIAHSYSSSYHLYGIICTISGTTITARTDTAIYTTGNVAGSTISTMKAGAPSNAIFIVFGTGGSSTSPLWYGTILTYNTYFSVGTFGTVSSNYADNSSVVRVGSSLFIAHTYGSSYQLYGRVRQTLAQASTGAIEGLTKTECTTSQAGEVWVLN